MNIISKISSTLSRYIGVIIILFSVLAFYMPQSFAWATNYTATFLGVAMFGMGLTIKLADLKTVYKNKRYVLIGCLAQYTVMPFLAWSLCMVFKLPPDLAIGVILVGCCPGGTASNVITYIAGGDVALSVGMTTVSTLIAPLVTPLLVVLLGGAWVEVSFMAMLLSVVKIILVPVLLGIVINTLFGKQISGITGILPLISVIAIVMIIAGIVAQNTEKIISSGIFVLAIVMIHNICGILVGLLLGRITKMNKAVTTAISVEIAMQNSGLAVSLAAVNFATNPLATLPGAIFSVVQNLTGSIFASIRNAKNQPEEIHNSISKNGYKVINIDK
ncbi:MAG: bile acid:sodium symporter family protein [Aminipila sp.]